MDIVKSTTWIAVNKDIQFTEHNSIEQAIALCPQIIFCEKEVTWKNGCHNNYAYGVDFYSVEGLKLDGVYVNNWRISDLRIHDGGYQNSYQRHFIRFAITDPWGSTEEHFFGQRRGGITSAITFLNVASKYYCWQAFRKEDPVEKEKSEICLLQAEIGQLKLDQVKLRVRLEAIREMLLTLIDET